MDYPRILIQLDSDSHPSVFDAVVAIDSGIEHLLQYSNVEPTNTRQLVHGAMFTRGPADLKHTAIFIGGSNVSLGDAIGTEVQQSFFGPIRVSVMLDGNGSNTTAAAAVLCAARHLDLSSANALILGGTGPVGQRVARLLLRQGGRACVASREHERAQRAREQIRSCMGGGHDRELSSIATSSTEFRERISSFNCIISCGASGVTLLSAEMLSLATGVQVAIDLNAVPPLGIEGIEQLDKAVQRGQRFDYGAIGVGGLKMKIHRESVSALFTRNDLYLDAEEIFTIGRELEARSS